MRPEESRKLAEAVKQACLKAARKAYEEAAVSGLCHEGAVEAFLDAIQMLDVKALLPPADISKKPG